MEKEIDRDTLRDVAQVHDWQRTIRTLRQIDGYDIEATAVGYILHSSEPKPTGKHRDYISSKLRYAVLQRDNSTCQRCGRSVSDGVKLRVDHKILVDMGGETTLNNLWTLCEDCNGGKKHFFSDEDAELLKKIMSMSSAYKKLKAYFCAYPNVTINPVKLETVSGVRDWERVVRKIRSDEHMNIVYVRPTTQNPLGGYIYIYQRLINRSKVRLRTFFF